MSWDILSKTNLQYLLTRLKEVTDSITRGHGIKNASGLSMTQRNGLEFSDAHVSDDSTNDKTIVDVIKETSNISNETEEGFYFDTSKPDVIAVLKMESGVASITCTQANYNFNEDILFTVDFTNVPQVMVCIDGDGTVGGSTVSCRNITSTGVRVSAQTTKTDNPTIKVKWLAIGI